MRCLSPSELRRLSANCRLLAATGILAILAGIAIGLWANWPTSVPVSVRVDGMMEAVSQDGQAGSVLNQLRFYPTATVEYDGRAERVVLPDFYVDRAMAQEAVGNMREIHVDKESLQPVEPRPFQPLFLMPLLLGLADLCAGVAWWYRYSDYRRLDGLSRAPKGASIMRRGAA